LQNQDSFILAPNVKSRPALHIFGVCDGHGNSGREASNFVKFALPIAIEEGMEDQEPDTDEKVTNLLCDAFGSVNEAFIDNVPDYKYSGATCTATLLNGHRIYAANCGDSRAILVNKYRKITVLTNDHKVDVESERQRILEKGGTIAKTLDPKTNEPTGQMKIQIDKKGTSGFTMTRCLGNYSAHKIGLSAKPGKWYLMSDLE